MAKYRRDRINDEMRREMMDILRKVKDPRVQDAFVSVTAVDCTADLKYAKIYYSALRGDEKELAKGLKAATGFIRRELAAGLNLRITPELTFVRDNGIAHGAEIASILHELHAQDAVSSSGDADDTETEAGE